MKIYNKYIEPVFSENWRSAFSGIMMGFVFAPFSHIYILVYVILVPFLNDVSNARSMKSAAVKGYWFGFFSAISALNWTAFNTISGFIAILVIHPWSYILFAIALFIFNKRLGVTSLFPASVFWIIMEMSRSWGQLRFPWINLYYALSYDIHFIQIAELAGPLAISFFIIIVNFFFLVLWQQWRSKKKNYIPILFLLLISFSFWVTASWWGKQRIDYFHNAEYPLIKAGIAQPDIDPYLKWKSDYKKIAYDRLFAYSDSLAVKEVKFIVWPETAIPTYIRNRPQLYQRLQAWVDINGIPLLTGIPDFTKANNRYFSYNAALLVHPGIAMMDVYYKHFLVPGGETIPFKNYFPVLEKIDVGGGNFWPGKEIKTLNQVYLLPRGSYNNGAWRPKEDAKDNIKTEVRVIPAICYESVFPELMRIQKKNNHGNLITVITNDGWYGRTAAPFQHFRASVFRSIETRTSVVRAANNGLSGFIDCCGDVFEETLLFTHDYRAEFLPVVEYSTLYEKYGLRWIWWLVAFSLIFVLYREIFVNTIIPDVDNRA